MDPRFIALLCIYYLTKKKKLPYLECVVSCQEFILIFFGSLGFLGTVVATIGLLLRFLSTVVTAGSLLLLLTTAAASLGLRNIAGAWVVRSVAWLRSEARLGLGLGLRHVALSVSHLRSTAIGLFLGFLSLLWLFLNDLLNLLNLGLVGDLLDWGNSLVLNLLGSNVNWSLDVLNRSGVSWLVYYLRLFVDNLPGLFVDNGLLFIDNLSGLFVDDGLLFIDNLSGLFIDNWLGLFINNWFILVSSNWHLFLDFVSNWLRLDIDGLFNISHFLSDRRKDDLLNSFNLSLNWRDLLGGFLLFYLLWLFFNLLGTRLAAGLGLSVLDTGLSILNIGWLSVLNTWLAGGVLLSTGVTAGRVHFAK